MKPNPLSLTILLIVPFTEGMAVLCLSVESSEYLVYSPGVCKTAHPPPIRRLRVQKSAGSDRRTRAMRALRTVLVTAAAVATLALSTPGAAGRAAPTEPATRCEGVHLRRHGRTRRRRRGGEVGATGPDYGHFRAIMAAETNAAIDGAARAGATEFVVRDSHGEKQNLLPGDVDSARAAAARREHRARRT